jgi:hypothetical protein
MSEAASSKVTAVDYDPFAATSVARVVPTTEAQRELWLADKLGREASLAFNEAVTLQIEGVLGVDAMQDALLELSNRHEALRSVLSDDGLSLFISPEGSLRAARVDLTMLGGEQQAAKLAQLRVAAVETPFDLVNGPLINATLVQLAAEKHELIIAGHHVVCDGWSFGVLARELMQLYQAIHSGVATSPRRSSTPGIRRRPRATIVTGCRSTTAPSRCWNCPPTAPVRRCALSIPAAKTWSSNRRCSMPCASSAPSRAPVCSHRFSEPSRRWWRDWPTPTTWWWACPPPRRPPKVPSH